MKTVMYKKIDVAQTPQNAWQQGPARPPVQLPIVAQGGWDHAAHKLIRVSA
jgi:hypothetical protein